MATTFTDTLFATEYKDDFSDSAGFYRILYNGGKVLQSRELTQMQTIINKQIERFVKSVNFQCISFDFSIIELSKLFNCSNLSVSSSEILASVAFSFINGL